MKKGGNFIFKTWKEGELPVNVNIKIGSIINVIQYKCKHNNLELTSGKYAGDYLMWKITILRNSFDYNFAFIIFQSTKGIFVLSVHRPTLFVYQTPNIDFYTNTTLNILRYLL